MSDIEIGSWKQDKDGRWYRMFGNTKEYRAELKTSTGTIYSDQVQEYGERIKDQEERERIQQSSQPYCPFRARKAAFEKNGYCSTVSCAWYDGKGCGIVSGIQGEGVGMICPISDRACRRECIAYASDGCRMIRRYLNE